MRLRPQVHREHLRHEVILLSESSDHLGRERRRPPRVHHVGVSREASGPVALVFGVPVRHVTVRVYGKLPIRGLDGVVVVYRAVRPQRVPQRNRHTEEPLPAEQPVGVQPVHPVLIPHAHRARMPFQFAPALQELFPQVHVEAAVLQVPLSARDDLQRTVALLIEAHRVRDRLRLGVKLAGLLQKFGHSPLRLVDAQARQLVVVLLRLLRIARLPSLRAPLHGRKPPVTVHDTPRRKLHLPPPHHVRRVAKGAHHRRAGTLLRIRRLVRHHGHLHPKQGRGQALAKELLIPFVVRVRHHRHTRRKQLRPRRLDGNDASLVTEVQPVVCRVLVAVLDLRLGHRRLERPVPQRRRLSLVRLPASQIVEEEPLRNPLHRLVNRRIGQRPVHRQAQIPPEVLERLLVFLREAVAQFDKVPARNRNRRLRRLGRRLEVGVVRRCGVAPHAVVVLHPALRRQAVVVPPHRVEDLTAPHPLVSRYRVGMRIREDVPDV